MQWGMNTHKIVARKAQGKKTNYLRKQHMEGRTILSVSERNSVCRWIQVA
jgi:hypothetical protein